MSRIITIAFGLCFTLALGLIARGQIGPPGGGGGGGTPCTSIALSVQYNNAGAFGCSHFTIDGSGNMIPDADINYNIGSSSNRINQFRANFVLITKIDIGGGELNGANNNSLSIQGLCLADGNGCNTNDGTFIAFGATNVSTAPMLVRRASSTTISALLSDNSADAPVTTGNLTSSGYHMVGSATALTLNAGEQGMAKITASGSAPGAAGAKFEVVCGTNAGSAKMIMYAGTSTTPVTIIDNVGSGVTGC